jgi:hypothetical protein
VDAVNKNPALVPALFGTFFLVAFVVVGILTRPPVTLIPGRVGQTGGGAGGAPAAVAPGQGAQVVGAPTSAAGEEAGKPTELEGGAPAAPSIVLNVRRPAKVRAALGANAWLQEVAQKPLGRGFLGGWSAFLLSRGEDLKAPFSGLVLDYFAEQLLAGPFALVWYHGAAVSGAPAIVALSPAKEARLAFAAFDQLTRRGTVQAKQCPGGAPAEGLEIARWMVADHPLYAALGADRLVFGRSSMAVLDGLCTAPNELGSAAPPADADPDVELALMANGFGREAEVLSSALGVKEALRVGFGVDGERIVPRGIRGALSAEGRLASAPLGEGLLRVVPEDMPVVLTLELLLPRELTPDALKAFLGGAGGGSEPRQLALLWDPHGVEQRPTDVALVWATAKDGPALAAMFSGKNAMEKKELCGNAVLASSGAMLARLERTCDKKLPSVLNAAPAVVAGLAQPSSIGLELNLGRLLSQLVREAWEADRPPDIARIVAKQPPPPPPPPAELLEALRQLELLPYLGFLGTADRGQLVPKGFRS